MSTIDVVQDKVVSFHNQQVIIDADVAELYGVSTKRISEAVKNNSYKFPSGYIVELSETDKKELVENFDRFSSPTPKAFAEKGLYMLATILRSTKAAEKTVSSCLSKKITVFLCAQVLLERHWLFLLLGIFFEYSLQSYQYLLCAQTYHDPRQVSQMAAR